MPAGSEAVNENAAVRWEKLGILESEGGEDQGGLCT